MPAARPEGEGAPPPWSIHLRAGGPDHRRPFRHLVTHEGVPAETVYNMTKSMFDNLDQMVAAHAAAKVIKKEDGPKNMPLPLHPGAEKYYREAGLIK